MANLLSINNLTKRFTGLVAVDDLSFEMSERSIHSLIGPNGAGKTTVVNMITGACKPTSGSIKFADTECVDLRNFEIARLGISRTFQNLKLYTSMTVMENLMTGAHACTSQGIVSFIFNIPRARREEKELREKAKKILNDIDLYDMRDEYVGNLPYGKQKMTEFGRALMTDPKLLLLDEPAAGLNPSERAEFTELIRRTFDKGVDIFLIEHNMDIIMNISHKITVINFGSKIAEGTPNEVQNNEEVIKAYLGEKYQQIGEA